MKLIQADHELITFQISRREHTLLTALLGLYPLTPDGRETISRHIQGPLSESARRLLVESMAAHKRDVQTEVAKWLGADGRFKTHENSFRFQVTAAEQEWLLEVLNEVRVGAWHCLDCPDLAEVAPPEPGSREEQFHWAMDLAAYFQMAILKPQSSVEL